MSMYEYLMSVANGAIQGVIYAMIVVIVVCVAVSLLRTLTEG